MRSTALRFSAVFFLTVVACDDDPANPVTPVPVAIRAFVASENLPLFRNVTVDVAIPERDVTLFSAEYGEAHDCPAGCFYDHAFGTAYGASIGWMGFSASSLPASPTMFDLKAEDAALFEAGVWTRIEAEQSWQYWNIFIPYVARDADTPGEALLRIATRLQSVIYPHLATQLLANPTIATHMDVLLVLACLSDAYEPQRQQARDLLGAAFPGCSADAPE